MAAVIRADATATTASVRADGRDAVEGMGGKLLNDLMIDADETKLMVDGDGPSVVDFMACSGVRLFLVAGKTGASSPRA